MSGDDFFRIRSRSRSPVRPADTAAETAYLGSVASDSESNGAFTPIHRATVRGNESEGASPTVSVESGTSLAFPLEGRLSAGQLVPVGWSGYRWSCPVPRVSIPPVPPPPSGCPDPDPDTSPYRFRCAVDPDGGPYPMHWDESLDAWVGQVEMYSSSPPSLPIWKAEICGNYDPDAVREIDPDGASTLGVALRRITRPARLTAQVSGGQIVGVTIDDPGYGYLYFLNNYSDSWGLRFTGGGGRSAWAVARTDIDQDGYTVPYDEYQYGGLASVTIVNGGTGYTSAPTVEVVTSDSWINTRVISYSLWKCNTFGGGYYVPHSGTGWVPTPPGAVTANRCDPEFSSYPPDKQDGFYMGWELVTEDCDAVATRFGYGGFVIVERDWIVRLAGVETAFSAVVTP